MEEDIESYTIISAYMSNEEEDKGKIKPGYLADFIFLDRVITEVEQEKILDTKVMKTFLGGELVYERV